MFAYLEFGTLFFVISLFAFIYRHTSTEEKPEGAISAYSVFNENGKRMDGQLTSDVFEKEIYRK